MTQINVSNTSVIYRGTLDHPHRCHAAFPSVAQMPDGKLVVTMMLGRRRDTADVRCYCIISDDMGKTWSSPNKLFEPDESKNPVSAGIRMSKVTDGTLVGFVNLLNRVDPEAPTTNRDNGGTVPRDHAMIRSPDGRAWSSLEPFEPPLNWDCFGEPSPVLAVSDDRWLLPSLTRLDWQGQCPYGLKSFVSISEDQGKTWPRYADVFDLWSKGIITWEQKQVVLSDGRILAVTWAFNSETKQNLPNHYTFSGDQGETYGTALQSPLYGQTCTPLALAGERILCIYRRLDKNGLWAHLAKIQGDRWVGITEKCLWGQDREAIAGGADSSIQHQHGLQFGYPQLIKLTSGDIFAVFWAVEDELSVIRCFHLQVES
tara:strand:- start:1065 stop:2180 length:1116 start_codon:yes stop_codon:yes gene_type:complete